MDDQKQYCHGCSRHCPFDDLRCGRGRKLLRKMQEKEGQLAMQQLEGAEGHPMGDHWCTPVAGSEHPGHHHHHYPSTPKEDRQVDPAAIARLDAPLAVKTNALLRYLGKAMGKVAGKQMRLRLLNLLHQGDGQGMDVPSLAQRLGVGEGAVARMLRKLEKDGMVHLIHPTADPDDHLPQLSKVGQARVDRWVSLVPDSAFAGYEGLSSEEQAQLFTLLHKLASHTPWQVEDPPRRG